MTVLSYSPSHSDPAVLHQLTVGKAREKVLERLVASVRVEVGRKTHQHQLLIGPRGSGKTHMLTLVTDELRKDSKLYRRVLPVPLAEEEVAAHPADFFVKILRRLEGVLALTEGLSAGKRAKVLTSCRDVLHRLRTERDDDHALALGVGALEEMAETTQRLVVPMVENLDSLLYAGPGLSRKSATDSQWALRKALTESKGVMLVASAPSLFGEITSERAPFYKFFRTHTLGELKPTDMLALIRRRIEVELSGRQPDRATERRLRTLLADFEQRSAQLRGLLVMTGGVPRFAHLIFDLLVDTDIASAVEMLERFLDAQTPFFQTRLDPRVVPSAELEVLDVMASADGPLPAGEIAAQLRGASPNATATYLKRLRNRGLVRQQGNRRKDIRYDLSEPLFRVWRRFRIGRSERERIVNLAEFVAAMFEPVELRTERHTWSLERLDETIRDDGRDLLSRVRPLLQSTKRWSSARIDLVHFSVSAVAQSPSIFLKWLPQLEAGLPPSHTTLLHPTRLAAEILDNRRSDELTDQSEEMRRAVAEVLGQVAEQRGRS